MIKFLPAVLMACVLIAVLTGAKKNENVSVYIDREANIWEQQLNEMNFITMRLSAINLINGLNLNPIQIQRLKVLQMDIDNLQISHPATFPDLAPEVSIVRNTYQNLTQKNLNNDQLSDSYIDTVFQVRISQSKLVKKTITGRKTHRNTALGCLKCHALPRHFPTGDIDKINTRPIGPFKRKAIDKAHIIGMFGETGNLKYWELRHEVDNLLSAAQKEIAYTFSYCIIPPQDLSDPMRAGQAFTNDRWLGYLTNIRKMDDRYWHKQKHRYLQPLSDFTDAALPGISRRNKNKALKSVEKILNEARKMDELSYDLHQEEICKRLNACFVFENAGGAVTRGTDIKKYITAMLLLYPENTEVYDALLSRQY